MPDTPQNIQQLHVPPAQNVINALFRALNLAHDVLEKLEEEHSSLQKREARELQEIKMLREKYEILDADLVTAKAEIFHLNQQLKELKLKKTKKGTPG